MLVLAASGVDGDPFGQAFAQLARAAWFSAAVGAVIIGGCCRIETGRWFAVYVTCGAARSSKRARIRAVPISISMLTTRAAAAGGAVPHPLWRIRVERYHRMIHAGVLTADDQVELLEGLLVAQMHKSPRHCAAGRLVRLALEAVMPEYRRARSWPHRGRRLAAGLSVIWAASDFRVAAGTAGARKGITKSAPRSNQSGSQSQLSRLPILGGSVGGTVP